jgi:hypothetical protein
MTVNQILAKIDIYILNPIILLLFAIASVVFIFGIVQFIGTAKTDEGRSSGKRKLIFGLLGMFIMISAYGIIHLILGTLGITNDVNQQLQKSNFITF